MGEAGAQSGLRRLLGQDGYLILGAARLTIAVLIACVSDLYAPLLVSFSSAPPNQSSKRNTKHGCRAASASDKAPPRLRRRAPRASPTPHVLAENAFAEPAQLLALLRYLSLPALPLERQ